MSEIRETATVWRKGERWLELGWVTDDDNAIWSSYFDLTSWFGGHWMPQEQWTINWLGLEGATLGDINEIWGDSLTWDFEFPVGLNQDYWFGMIVRELRARLELMSEPIDSDRFDNPDYGKVV